MNSTSDARNPVELLAEEFLDRKSRGERPTLEEYLERHPELAEQIRDLFPALVKRVLHKEPERLNKRAANVPRDLETIIAKATAREVHDFACHTDSPPLMHRCGNVTTSAFTADGIVGHQ